MKSPAQTAARYTLAILIVLLMFSIIQLAQWDKERRDRIKSVAKEHVENEAQAKELVKVQKQLDQATRDLQNAKIKSCNDLNNAIKRQITTEFVRSVNVMNQLLGVVRNGVAAEFANSFIANNVRTVKEANPYYDCSAKALGIISIPLPKSSSSSSPKELLAGIQAMTIQPIQH